MFSVKIKNIVATIDIGFLAVIAIISLNGGKFSLQSFTACLIHEAGHFAAIFILGGDAEKISMTAAGISVKRSCRRLCSAFTDLMIVLSGPAASLAAAGTSYAICGKFTFFSAVNLILGIFNLLPFSVLDGGSALEIISECCPDTVRLSNTIRFFNILLCIVLITVLFAKKITNISLYVMCIFLVASEIKKIFTGN